MNYKFDENIIHDSESMWDLACDFKCHYEFIKNQVEMSKIDSYIMYKGNVVMTWDENYKNILSDYKKELKFMNEFLTLKLTQENNKLQKYIAAEQ